MADPEYKPTKAVYSIPLTDETIREAEEDWLWNMGITREEFARRMQQEAARG